MTDEMIFVIYVVATSLIGTLILGVMTVYLLLYFAKKSVDLTKAAIYKIFGGKN